MLDAREHVRHESREVLALGRFRVRGRGRGRVRVRVRGRGGV